jgi:hypothetical protein
MCKNPHLPGFAFLKHAELLVSKISGRELNGCALLSSKKAISDLTMACCLEFKIHLKRDGCCIPGFVLNHMDVAAMLRLRGYKVSIIFRSCSPQA